MSFKSVFTSILIGVCLIAAAVVLNSQRPGHEVSNAGPEFTKAVGKCAECHRQESSAIVHQFEKSAHAKKGVSCLDCHQVLAGQENSDHKGFNITTAVTSKNCAECHSTEYDQFLRSRHAAPAWAAVRGRDDFTAEQIAAAEQYHKGTVDRNANGLAKLQGDALIQNGCVSCHSIGQPNKDGSIGDCTKCHSRHDASVEIARTPETCGQCHMGPDHAQLEIYNESKHGVLYGIQKGDMNLKADPKNLTTKDMPVPTCATCHLSGLEGLKVTHDTSERLSWWLMKPISKKRPNAQRARDEMQATCLKCHAKKSVDKFYADADANVLATNKLIEKSQVLWKELVAEGLITKAPFDHKIDFVYFDLWHHYGRTSKHGAFMGGADYVQWHGVYEILQSFEEMKLLAKELRAEKSEKHD